MKINSDDNPFKGDLSGVYGHEQRHFAAFQKEANEQIKPLVEAADKVYCGGVAAATDIGRNIHNKIHDIQSKYDELKLHGKNHWRPHPEKGRPYPPIGEIPTPTP